MVTVHKFRTRRYHFFVLKAQKKFTMSIEMKLSFMGVMAF